MGKPSVGILARDRCERFGNGLLQGLPRAAFARKSVLTLDQHSSIGDKSGEYGGR
jgi:hypothetical protein